MSIPFLVGGPYRMPTCCVGDTLRDEIRGEVVVRGITDAPVPWPFARRIQTGSGGGGTRSPVVCGDLASAIRRESTSAVAHHWGVSIHLVMRWKRAIGVLPATEGSEANFRERAGRPRKKAKP